MGSKVSVLWSSALVLVGLLAGCGETAQPGTATGPYASFPPSPNVQVANNSCASVTAPTRIDLLYIQSPLVRQGTSLQRVSDDLTGAVPGGNTAIDTRLAADSADSIKTIITSTSTICEPIRSHLLEKLKALLDADHALAEAGAGGGNVAGALAPAQTAYQALKAYAENPS